MLKDIRFAQNYLGRNAHQPYSETDVLTFRDLMANLKETSELILREHGKHHPDKDDEEAWL